MKKEIFSDRAVKLLVDDKYGFGKTVVPRLARVTLDWPGEDGLIIGLYGSWGIGKTSILNMFAEYIKLHEAQYKNTYLVRFNPWIYEDHAALVASFFGTIAGEVGKNLKKPWKGLSKGLKGMGTFLSVASKGVSIAGVKVDLEQIGEAAKAVGELGDLVSLADSGEKRLQDDWKNVETELKKLGGAGGRVVVLIDDVDRLAKNELLALLRLLRIVADLSYVSIVIAMDEQRVRDVLAADTAAAFGEHYLKKIVQVGIHVPLPSPDILRQELASEFERVFLALGLRCPDELKTNRQLWMLNAFDDVASLIAGPRDLYRYINSLRMLLLVGDDPDINLIDAALVEALHVFLPDVYERVRKNKIFLLHLDRSDILSTNDGLSQAKRDNDYDAIILNGTKSDQVSNILNRLFPYARACRPRISERQLQAISAERRISDSEFFNRYFMDVIEEGDVTAKSVFGFLSSLHEEGGNLDAVGVRNEMIKFFGGYGGLGSHRIVRDLYHRLEEVPWKSMVVIIDGALDCFGFIPNELLTGVLSAISVVIWRDIYQPEVALQDKNAVIHDMLKRVVQNLGLLFFVDLFDSIRTDIRLSEGDLQDLAKLWLLKFYDQFLPEDDWYLNNSDADRLLLFARWHAVDFVKNSEIVRNLASLSKEFLDNYPSRLPQILEQFCVRSSQRVLLVAPGYEQPASLVRSRLVERLGDIEWLRSILQRSRQEHNTEDPLRLLDQMQEALDAPEENGNQSLAKPELIDE
ncbi:MAG: P-loop NTPase fold protein [Bacteroidota bacterium]